jgi:signal transduction histidine kinase
LSERDAAALDAVVAVSRALAGRSDLTAILDLVAKRGRALVDARGLAVEVQGDVAAVAGELPEGLGAARDEAASAVLVVPLVLRGRAYGALVAVDRRDGGRRFTIEDEELLEALAALAAGAVAAQRFSQARRPVALDHVGLAGAIELLADLVESPELEICTRLDLSRGEGQAADRLDSEVETAVYRIVQEALDNAVKHARASRVQVELTEDEELGEVTVEISDDGDGFDPAVGREGVGLSRMRERVDLLGGSIEIRSTESEGTRITVTLPSGRRWRSMLSID